MEQSKIERFIAVHGRNFPQERIGIITSQLERIDDTKYIAIQSASYKSDTTLLIVSIFLGGFGVDRFMLGQTGAGIGKLLTGGGCTIWWLIDIFTIMKATREYNFKLFAQLAS